MSHGRDAAERILDRLKNLDIKAAPGLTGRRFSFALSELFHI